MNKIIGMYSLTKLANNLQIWQNLFNKYSDKYKINIYCGKIDTACDIAHINDCYMLRDIDKKFIGNRLLQIHTTLISESRNALRPKRSNMHPITIFQLLLMLVILLVGIYHI